MPESLSAFARKSQEVLSHKMKMGNRSLTGGYIGGLAEEGVPGVFSYFVTQSVRKSDTFDRF